MIKPLPPQYRIFCDIQLVSNCRRISHELFMGEDGQKKAEEFLAKGTGGWAVGRPSTGELPDKSSNAHFCPECMVELNRQAEEAKAARPLGSQAEPA